METLHITANKEQPDKTCTVLTSQTASVSVPVTVKPRVSTGGINTFCCGEPKVTPSPYVLSCKPSCDARCSFVLTQNICIEIPVEFSADAIVSPPSIQCADPPKIDEKCCK